MITLDTPMPFSEALRKLYGKEPMPTELSSAEIRRLDKSVRDRALFSARTTSLDYLQGVGSGLEKLLQGTHNIATVRHELQQLADALGYDSEHGHFGTDADANIPPAEHGTLRDLASRGRIDLVLQTNMRQMANYGRLVQGSTEMALFQFPAWELRRIYARQIPRGYKLKKGHIEPAPGEDWPSRWAECGGVFYGGGRMIARKDDPIWTRIGSSALFPDGLDAPFPPFAFGSGFGWAQVARDEAIRLGVISKEGKVAAPKNLNPNEGVQVSVSRFSKEILQAALKEINGVIDGTKLLLKGGGK